jgi:hypothetical protein
MAGHILGNGMIASLVLRFQRRVQTKNHITILFKKIKDFLIIGALNSNLFCGNSAATLSFFRDCARKKWPLRGSKHADNLK